MRWAWKALFLAVALVLGNRLLLILAMEPWSLPAPGGAGRGGPMRTVMTALHVHSHHSHDGYGTVEEIRGAARDAGVAVVALTDHNTLAGVSEETPHWPALVVGEEISTTGGHVIALGVHDEVRHEGAKEGMSIAEAIDAVNAQGGLAIIAHPSHPKTPWDRSARERVQGLEIYNADEDWRDESALDLLGSLVTYPFAPVRSLSLLLDRPSRNLALWDSLLAERDVVGVGACDAHGGVGLPGGLRIPLPGYWEGFALVSTAVWPWWRDTAADSFGVARLDPSASLERNLESGHAAVIFRSLGTAEGFKFHLRRGNEIIWTGGRAALRPGLRAHLVALVPGGDRAIVRILKDGRIWREGRGPYVDEPVTEPGVYRCEVSQRRRLPPLQREKEFPWIFSNAIRVVSEP